MGDELDPVRMEAVARRDELWASLHALRPAIDRLAKGVFDGSDLEQRIISLLARIVQAELDFRAPRPLN